MIWKEEGIEDIEKWKKEHGDDVEPDLKQAMDRAQKLMKDILTGKFPHRDPADFPSEIYEPW